MRDRNAPLSEADIAALAWEKMDGLLPAIVQDRGERQLLMLGYMNAEALRATLASGFATFFSRSQGPALAEGRDQRQSPARRRRSTRIATATPCSSAPSRRARPAISARPAASASDDAPGPGWLAAAGADRRQRAPPADPRPATPPACSPKARRASPRRSARKASKSRSPRVSRDAAGCVEEVADLSIT